MVLTLDLMYWKAWLCDYVFYCGDFHFSICGNGCIRCGQMEDGADIVRNSGFSSYYDWSTLHIISYSCECFSCFLIFLSIATCILILILFGIFSSGDYFGLFFTIITLVLVGRAAFVFPLSALANYMRKSSDTKITFRQQVVSFS